MQQMPFIYSNELRWRIMRHLSFWLLWFLFQLFLYSFSPSPVLQEQSFRHRLLITWPDTFLYLIPSLFLAYTLMYVVIPKLILPGKYLMATVSVALLIVLTGAFSAGLSLTLINYVRHLYADPVSQAIAAERNPPFYIQFGVAMLAGLRGSITVGGVAAAIKLMKCFYEKQQAALVLEKEKVNAELQMLKAQLHPHFLFNTLNNIYSFTQDVSEKASGMIMGLSQLLRYMLYDCNKPLVPLQKELDMIHDYLALERIRYDERLDIAVQVPVPPVRLLIAPLMLLPFVENAFKHGASRMTEHPWISLSVTVGGGVMTMKLINGKPAGQCTTAPGIGIANVRKRLESLYPDAHELQIIDEEEMYIVNLRLVLLPAGEAEIMETIYEPVQNV